MAQGLEGKAPDSKPSFKQVLPTSLPGLEAGNLICAYLHRCVPTARLPHQAQEESLHQGQASLGDQMTSVLHAPKRRVCVCMRVPLRPLAEQAAGLGSEGCNIWPAVSLSQMCADQM